MRSAMEVTLTVQEEGSRALIVKPHQHVNRILHIGHERAIGVLRCVEQLVLLRLIRCARLESLLVPQRDEAIRLAPSLWLIAELRLSISVGTRRALPVFRGGFGMAYSGHDNQNLIVGTVLNTSQTASEFNGTFGTLT